MGPVAQYGYQLTRCNVPEKIPKVCNAHLLTLIQQECDERRILSRPEWRCEEGQGLVWRWDSDVRTKCWAKWRCQNLRGLRVVVKVGSGSARNLITSMDIISSLWLAKCPSFITLLLYQRQKMGIAELYHLFQHIEASGLIPMPQYSSNLGFFL